MKYEYGAIKESNDIFTGYLTFKYNNIYSSTTNLMHINFNITVYIQSTARLC
jgi:hypothetical protein